MRSRFVRYSAAVTTLVLMACNDGPSRPTGPVTLRFATPVFKNVGATTPDTVRATVVVDGTITAQAPFDTIPRLPRGFHTFEVTTDVEYLKSTFGARIDPLGSVAVLALRPTSCRIWEYDSDFCARRNRIAWSGSRIYCPAGDFGDFCTYFTDARHLAGTWPADSSGSAENEYIAHGKLLIGAVVGGNKVATSLYDHGDYSPRVRHHVIPGDSSYWQSEVWTDVRRLPIYPETEGILAITDRPNELLGLSVRTTYVLPSSQKNAMFIRFDVTNISDQADYRRVHPEEPVGGHTVTEVYLAPVIDPDIGGVKISSGGSSFDDSPDDNTTLFPNDSLVMAYDQAFHVPLFGGGYINKPGLVGMRLIEAPAGTQARALLLDKDTKLTFGIDASAAHLEDSTYNVISGGRTGDRSNCSPLGSFALSCKQGNNPESAHDVRIGWSVGPVASIAPGQTVSMTVAIIFAPPTPGTFVSQSSMAPQNDGDLTSTSRPIYLVAGQLRDLAAAVKGFVVNGTAR